MDATPTRTTDTPTDPARVLPVVSEYIGVSSGYCGGKPHILGHRIKVKHVAVWHVQMGMSPAEIVRTYRSITLAQVHAALAYYDDHKPEIDAEVAEEETFVEEVKAQSRSKVQERLRQPADLHQRS
jgi:uncharacterized protein (DUF433 family)